MTTALVLSSGGLTGIGWELGVLDSLREAGIDLTKFDRVIGTSAGSTVAAQLTTGQMDAGIQMQLADKTAEIDIQIDVATFMQQMSDASTATQSVEERIKNVGRWAKRASKIGRSERAHVITSRLPVKDWPEADLRLVTADVDTGRRVIFTKLSGVDLVDAVNASCAVPGVWPPAEVKGRTYIDGGVYSQFSLDVAVGCDRVVVLNAMAMSEAFQQQYDEERNLLDADSEVMLIQVDTASIEAFGPDPLSTATRSPALQAGRRQGKDVAEEVRHFLLS